MYNMFPHGKQIDGIDNSQMCLNAMTVPNPTQYTGKKKQMRAASLKRRKWDLGTPIRIKMLLILMNLQFILI